MNITRHLALALLAATCFDAAAATVTTVVDVPTRGVSTRFLYLRPDNPVANVVMWPGGDGRLGIRPDGTMTTLTATCNPAVRSRQALANEGYAVAVVGEASDSRVWQYADMVEVIRHLRARDNVPTWVIGGSLATSAALDLVAGLQADHPLGAVFYSPEAFVASQAAPVTAPSLVIYHPLDARQSGPALFTALAVASVREQIALTGGNNTGCAGYHTLNGLDGPFAAGVADFIGRHNPSLAAGGLASALAVEFYNASLDHYFVTHIANEIALLDAGVAIRGWVRTGQSFNVYTSAGPGTSPVCRFYIPPARGDSHFYGRGTAECDATGMNNPSFINEDPRFFHVVLPNAGTCPAATRIVYRVFSNRADANHRYLVDRALRDQMVTLGWLAEGDGPDLVVMCVPA